MPWAGPNSADGTQSLEVGFHWEWKGRGSRPEPLRLLLEELAEGGAKGLARWQVTGMNRTGPEPVSRGGGRTRGIGIWWGLLYGRPSVNALAALMVVVVVVSSLSSFVFGAMVPYDGDCAGMVRSVRYLLLALPQARLLESAYSVSSAGAARSVWRKVERS